MVTPMPDPARPELPVHGGDLAAATARWGQPEAGWLDLSTGINPRAYPLPELAPALWGRLPDTALVQAAQAAAAGAFGASPDQVLATPGTSAAIQALPRLLAPARVAVVSPTYGEHARAWAAAGHQVSAIAPASSAAALLDGAAGAAIIIVVNPNNPTGTITEPGQLRALAQAQAARGGLLIVDEAFADPLPELSLAGAIGPGLVVLRSFGKFFGLAGLRLGFCLAEPALLARLAAQWGPWPVSGPALAIAAQALADGDWARATRTRLAQSAASLDRVLSAAGLEILGGTPLFRLARSAMAARIHDRLGQAGILTRAFPDQPDWLRFGLPADTAESERLARALG